MGHLRCLLSFSVPSSETAVGVEPTVEVEETSAVQGIRPAADEEGYLRAYDGEDRANEEEGCHGCGGEEGDGCVGCNG